MNNTMTTEQVDVATIAKEIRAGIKEVQGAVFSVRINRQWASLKNDPYSVIWVEGMVKLWGDDYSQHGQDVLERQLEFLMQDIAKKYDLLLNSDEHITRWIFTQHH